MNSITLLLSVWVWVCARACVCNGLSVGAVGVARCAETSKLSQRPSAPTRSSTSGSGARPAPPRTAWPRAFGRPFGPTTFKQVESHLWETPGFPGLLRSRWQAGHKPGGVAILWWVFCFRNKVTRNFLRAERRNSNPQSWPSSPETLAPRKRAQLARQPALLYPQQELSAVLHSWTPSLEAATAPQAPLHPVLLTHSQTSNKLDCVMSPDSPGASEDPWPLGTAEFMLAMTSCTTSAPALYPSARSWTEALRNMTFRKATLYRNPHVKRKKDANNRPISSHTTRTPWRAPPPT